MNRHRRGIASQKAATVFGEPNACAVHLAGAASPAQLIDDFHDLRDSGGADRMALGEESAARIDDVDSAEIQGSSRQKLGTFTFGTDPEFLACDQFGGRGGVVNFEHVNVRGPDAGDFVRAFCDALERGRFVGCAIAP